ncbi:hypothetical protein EVAR_65609_1 [Eumeta japonica]|uniref:Uncharacterized protein n=1 Tax=Eumeta variegata TaxID=151549 RepID=A0A4C1ZBH6_EUMVA|nr:hypothetical protein EVAR_65609_1 [Eumeta japonica]
METIPGTSDVVGESHASTSEVGSAHREFEDHGADNLENFDRPVPSVPMEVYYEKMLKLQNNQIERLIQALKQPLRATTRRLICQNSIRTEAIWKRKHGAIPWLCVWRRNLFQGVV